MALIRLIANVKSREVLIFVNRIDELQDPAQQVPEIRAAITETLSAQKGMEHPDIIFGSAHWANCALQGKLDIMTGASAHSLLNWAEASLDDNEQDQSVEELIWALSGLPALYAAIAARVIEGGGRETVTRIARQATNLAQNVQASARMVIEAGGARTICTMEEDEIRAELQDMRARAEASLAQRFSTVLSEFHTRLDRSHRSFLDRATVALISHLETYGDEAVWSYDPTGLRLLLRSAYQVFGRKVQAGYEATMGELASDLMALYGKVFDHDAAQMQIRTPAAPRIDPPVLLGQTIALDLQGNFWTRWWQRRRGYRAYAMDFADMIKAETDPIILGLKDTHCIDAERQAQESLQAFFEDQTSALLNLAQDVRDGALKPAGPGPIDQLNDTLATLNAFAA